MVVTCTNNISVRVKCQALCRVAECELPISAPSFEETSCRHSPRFPNGNGAFRNLQVVERHVPLCGVSQAGASWKTASHTPVSRAGAPSFGAASGGYSALLWSEWEEPGDQIGEYVFKPLGLATDGRRSDV